MTAGAATSLVDLSHPVVDGMPVYPGDPPVRIHEALYVAHDGVAVRRLDLGSHTGTHVDSPAHVLEGAPTLDDLPLERFIGPCVVLDARDRAPRTPLGADLLDAANPAARARIGPGTIVLVATGWSDRWGTAEYAEHPYPTVELAQALVAAGVRTVGIDAYSVDETWLDGSGGLPAHEVLAAAGCVIAENLTGLDALLRAQTEGREVEVWLMPLRIGGGDGSPVRAVARIAETPAHLL